MSSAPRAELEIGHESAEFLQGFRAAMDAIRTAVVIMRTDGDIVITNAEADALFGYDGDELSGQPVEVLVPEQFRRAHVRHRQKYFEAPSARRMGLGLELQGVRKDGSEFPIEIGLNPLETDGGLLAVAVVVDVTERKRRQEWFREMVQSAPVAMALVDCEGRIVQINPQTEALFGYGADELLGQYVETLVPERFRAEHPALRDRYQQQPAARPMGLGRTVYGRRKDGGELELEVSLSPIASESTVESVLVMAVDVTQQRRREREQARNAAELARINRSLEEFAFMASHDLQEPLRKVASCCQVLKEDYSHRLDDEGREWLDYAIEGSQRIQSMVRDLLAFSRLGRKDEAIVPTDAAEACRLAIDNLQMAIRESEARIACGPLPTVLASMTQLVQLFQNLIGNAIKYRGETTPDIEVGAERDNLCWRFHVKDNGIGIAPEYHERVFAIFQRLHKRGEFGGGTGIGLAIVKKTVEQFGGKVWIESTLGEGSTFYFTMPGIDDATEPPAGTMHGVPLPPGGTGVAAR